MRNDDSIRIGSTDNDILKGAYVQSVDRHAIFMFCGCFCRFCLVVVEKNGNTVAGSLFHVYPFGFLLGSVRRLAHRGLSGKDHGRHGILFRKSVQRSEITSGSPRPGWKAGDRPAKVPFRRIEVHTAKDAPPFMIPTKPLRYKDYQTLLSLLPAELRKGR